MGILRRIVLPFALALAAAAANPAQRTFVVTSLGLSTVSIDGGRVQGVSTGDRLRVVAGEKTVAELEVVSVAEQWASCRTISLTRPIAPGDVVVPLPRASAPSSAPVAKPAPPATVRVASPSPTPTPKPTPVRTPAASPALSPASATVSSPAAPPANASRPPASPTTVSTSAAEAAPPRAFAAMAPRPEPAAPASKATFKVRYRSAANVYLDAGRAQGLRVADRLEVVDATVVAELEVVYVAEQSASCKLLSEKRPVRPGDVARLTSRGPAPPEPPSAMAVAAAPAAPSTTSLTAAAPAAAPVARPPAPWARMRGSVSFGYYQAWDQTESAYDFQERTGRLDLGLYDIAGQPLSFTLRGRSRQDVRSRTLSDRTPDSERTDRLYEAALRYEPSSDQFGVEVGRIGIYRFVGIGYLDGALARFRPARAVQVGAFGGRVADVDGLAFNGTGSKYGGFVRLAPGGRYARGGYDAMLAFVRENADGDVSREYLSLESRFGGSRWSLFERAELDLNGGWRKEITGKSYQLSNLSFSGNLRVASSAWAFVSYDGLRNYRYFRNRIVPEEVFDDLLHQGLRAGINLSRPTGFGASAGFGMSLKEPDPRHPELDIANAYSFNAGVRHANLFSSGFSAGIDGSGFSNGYTDGGLVMARVGRRFDGGHMLDLSIGRSVYRVKQTEQDRTTQWLRLMGRGELGHRVYLQGDFEYDSGDDLKGPRAFLELGILF